MSDASAFGFGKFVPGFDFLQNLAKSAGASGGGGASLPGMSNWVAPTLSVEELDKRIQELKAVQFWLEQNSTALKATIQALEVQKMTLSTLQGMNVNMTELAKAFSAQMPPAGAPPTTAKAAAPSTSAAAAPEPAPAHKPARPRPAKAATSPKATAGAGNSVDPMQWWGSLTQQFQNIASAAMQDVAAEALKAQQAGGGAAAKKGKASTSDKPARAASHTSAKRPRSSRP